MMPKKNLQRRIKDFDYMQYLRSFLWKLGRVFSRNGHVKTCVFQNRDFDIRVICNLSTNNTEPENADNDYLKSTIQQNLSTNNTEPENADNDSPKSTIQ